MGKYIERRRLRFQLDGVTISHDMYLYNLCVVYKDCIVTNGGNRWPHKDNNIDLDQLKIELEAIGVKYLYTGNAIFLENFFKNYIHVHPLRIWYIQFKANRMFLELYHEVVEKRYQPGGKGYIESLEDFNFRTKFENLKNGV